MPFERPPESLDELYRVVEQLFRGEETDIKRTVDGGEYRTRPSEPFTCRRIQRFDDETRTWVEVTSEKQLAPYDQLYVFRKNATRADISTERELPEPRSSIHFPQTDGRLNGLYTSNANRRASTATVSHLTSSPHTPTTQQQTASSSRRGGESRRYSLSREREKSRVTSSSCVPECIGGNGSPQGFDINARADKVVRKHVEAVYSIGDACKKGYLTAREFQGIFRSCHIDFPFDAIDDIYRVFADDRDGDRAMTIRNFYEFAHSFNQTVNIAYARFSNERRQQVVEQEQRGAESALEELQKQKRILEERLEEMQKQIVKEQERRARLQNEADELRMSRDPSLREEEQRLLEKEVSVFQYRKKLLQEEVDYEKLVAERRRRSAAVMGHTKMLPQTFKYGYDIHD